MLKLWTKSRRQIYLWAADPAHCENYASNPLEKMSEMLVELDKNKHYDIIEGALHLLVRDLGYQIIPGADDKQTESTSLNKTFLQLFSRTGDLSKILQSCDEKKVNRKTMLKIQAHIDGLKMQLRRMENKLRKMDKV